MLTATITSTGAAAAADILAAATGTRYVIHKIELTVTAAAAVKVHEGADATTSRPSARASDRRRALLE